MVEIIITAVLVATAAFILIRNFKRKAQDGNCDCGSCSSHCPQYKTEDKK